MSGLDVQSHSLILRLSKIRVYHEFQLIFVDFFHPPISLQGASTTAKVCTSYRVCIRHRTAPLATHLRRHGDATEEEDATD